MFKFLPVKSGDQIGLHSVISGNSINKFWLSSANGDQMTRPFKMFLVAAVAMSLMLAPRGPAVHANATNAACPFCSSIALTFTEQLNANEIAVVAELVEPPPPPEPDEDGFLEYPQGKFRIVGILKGDKFVKNDDVFETQLVGTHPVGQKFLIMGVNPPRVSWTIPMKASDRVFKYLKDIQKLPEKGPDRLVFFQDYFENEEPMLAFDAYDEYAKAPYEDLIAMKQKMNRPALLGWIKDVENVTVSRRRLYLTMLGVCGKKEDAKILEEYLKSGDRKKQGGLDALIACYLTLMGEEGVQLIEEKFLKDPQVDYVDIVATVSALRFHATETDIVPQKRIVAAVRLLLDRPRMADLIIADLARWKDWSVKEKLVKMFKEADADSNWIRIPIVTYLRACPHPEAATYIEELSKIDPEAVNRADFYLGFGESDDDWDDEEPASESDKKTDEAKSEKDGSSETAEEKKHKAKLEAKKSETSDTEALQRLDVNVAKVAQSEERVSVAQGDPVVVDPSAENQTSVEMPTSVEQATFVSTSLPAAESMAQPIGEGSVIADTPSEGVEQVAAATAPMTGEEEPKENLTWKIILFPFAGSLLVFAVMWSVVNGWFERLIY